MRPSRRRVPRGRQGICGGRLRGQGTSSQTAKATEEIAGQVTAIQSATGDCVAAIGGISDTIREISGTATTIAAAVEEQGSATREIGAQRAAGRRRPRRFRTMLPGASEAADQSRALADNVMMAAANSAARLRPVQSVDTFLAACATPPSGQR